MRTILGPLIAMDAELEEHEKQLWGGVLGVDEGKFSPASRDFLNPQWSYPPRRRHCGSPRPLPRGRRKSPRPQRLGTILFVFHREVCYQIYHWWETRQQCKVPWIEASA